MAESNERKKIHRSPNHPFFDLAEAVEKARVIYDQEKRSSTSGEIIVKHLGYSALNGPGGRTLSGLRQYGLLEELAGRYKISDDAYAILHYAPESEQRKSALKRAARNPSLYGELLRNYPDLAVSDDSLRMTLLDKGFNPDVTARVIEHFRSTMKFAGLPDGSYTDLKESDKPMQTAPAHQTLASFPPTAATPGVQTYTFALSPDARAELSLKGIITPDDLDLLRDHIDLTIRALTLMAPSDRRQKQKDRIVATAQELCPECTVKFEDHGRFIWFKVVKGDVELIPYSSDQLVGFYEAMDKAQLATFLRALGGGRIK